MKKFRFLFAFLLAVLCVAAMQSGALADGVDTSAVTDAVNQIKAGAITVVGVLVAAAVGIYLAAFAIPAIRAGYRLIARAIGSLG
jgi:hypothetical protein